jgi:hypothetical protein
MSDNSPYLPSIVKRTVVRLQQVPQSDRLIVAHGNKHAVLMLNECPHRIRERARRSEQRQRVPDQSLSR